MNGYKVFQYSVEGFDLAGSHKSTIFIGSEILAGGHLLSAFIWPGQKAPRVQPGFMSHVLYTSILNARRRSRQDQRFIHGSDIIARGRTVGSPIYTPGKPIWDAQWSGMRWCGSSLGSSRQCQDMSVKPLNTLVPGIS